MRTLLTMGLFLSTLTFFAQSNLTVFNNGGQKFYLIMNGIKQNSLAQTNVVVSGIKNGGYSVKLIFEDGKTKDIDKNFFLDTPQDVTTKVTFKKGVGKLQLVSMVPTVGTVTGGSVTYRPDNNAVYSDAVTTTTTTTQTVSTETSNVSGANTNNGTGNGSAGIQFNATTPDPVPSTPNPPSNSGNGNVNISVSDPVNGENINMNVNINGTGVDPNAPNVNMNMNVNVSGSGTEQNTSNTRPGTNTNVNVGTTTNNAAQQTTTNGANVNVNVNGVNPTVNATVPGGNTNVTVSGGNVTQNSSTSTTTTTTTTTTNSSSSVNGSTNVTNGTATNTSNTVGGTSNGRMVCSKTLSNLETLKTELTAYSFEDDRVEAIKVTLKSKCLYAADAVKLLDLYSFDDNRLDVAKFLSDHLLDYDNASSLGPKMTFDSSKMEYLQYIGRD